MNNTLKMVLNHQYQDILILIKETEKIKLPPYKQTAIKIEYRNADDHVIGYHGPNPPLPFACSEIFQASICESRRLSAVDPKCKDVYEITFDIKNSNFNFKPGDTIGIIPHNIESEIDLIVQRLELQDVIDLTYTLSVDTNQHKAKLPVHIPVQGTLKHVLSHCLDLRGIVKKAFLLALSKHTTDDMERQIMEYLCSEEGVSSYRSHILNKNICLLDLLTMIESCKPPIEVILEHLPRLLPRPYSIANSPLKDKDILKICFSVMDIGNNRKGLTTSWLQSLLLNEISLEERLKRLGLNNETKIPIYLRKNISDFRLPVDITAPIIMVGPGTGVAPFIGFLEEREALHDASADIGDAWLFFGCRDPKLDYIYKNELYYFVNNGVLAKLDSAFSRSEVVSYVQDDIIRNSKEIAVLLTEEKAFVYVCGDVNKFVKTIKGSFVQCLVLHTSMTTEEAESYIADVIKEKRYLIDIWT